MQTLFLCLYTITYQLCIESFLLEVARCDRNENEAAMNSKLTSKNPLFPNPKIQFFKTFSILINTDLIHTYFKVFHVRVHCCFIYG